MISLPMPQICAALLTMGIALGLFGANESAPAEPWEIHLVLGAQPEPVARILAPLPDRQKLTDIQVFRDLIRYEFGSEAAHAYVSSLDLEIIVTGEVAFQLYTAATLHPDRQLAASLERLAFRLLRGESYGHPRFEAIRLLRLHILTSTTVNLFEDLGPEAYLRISLESGLAAAVRCLEVNDVGLALDLYEWCAKAHAELASILDKDSGPAIVAALEAMRSRHPGLEDRITACQKLYRK